VQTAAQYKVAIKLQKW